MQIKVRNFNQKRNCHFEQMETSARLMDIQSEIGELAKEYLKGSSYGSKIFELTEDFEMELGDVLYSLLSLADELNINAEHCLDKVIKKYEDRISKKNTMGSEGE